jgi:uncharacterized protein YdbL (DUF1318 family)
MRMTRELFSIGLFLLTLTFSCSIRAPEVRVTGEKTSLEREVVGTYEQMEEDTWMIASTRSERSEEEVKISPEKRRVLEVLQEQKFNKDDVDEFKEKGYVGENNQGFLEIRSPEKVAENPEEMELVQEIVREENNDREIIMERVIELNDNLKKSHREEIFGIFARMNQENSPSGTWIQKSNGDWVRK